MKNIIVFGAGKSATVLIDYLIKESAKEDWFVTVVDADIALAKSKTGQSSQTDAISFDINNETDRVKQIQRSDIVISMLPPALHFLVAKTCVELKKNLLTASYIDNDIKNLQKDIQEKDLLFLCEMGLDPGIDHMSAMKIINSIREKGGKINSFKSHCGGLVAPESDDNPWRYKISWNPRNIVMAGKAGARYKENGEEVFLEYEKLFDPERALSISDAGWFSYYPNRDSLPYISLYGLENAKTFMRTTLRKADFMYGWNNVVELNLTDEIPVYETNGKQLKEIFKEHLDKNDFGKWLDGKISKRMAEIKGMMENIQQLTEAQNEADLTGQDVPENFMIADSKGNLENIDIEVTKTKAAAWMSAKMHEANLTLKQLIYLGLDDEEIVNKGFCSAADILQYAMEKKLLLKPEDKDMIIMLHEFEYELEGKKYGLKSSLIVKGEDGFRTAMAKTVGLPLGIAAKLILNETITLKGLHIPTHKEIYEPVLKELELYAIKFNDTSEIK